MLDQGIYNRSHGCHARCIECLDHKAPDACVVRWIKIQDALVKPVCLIRWQECCTFRWVFHETFVFQDCFDVSESGDPPESESVVPDDRFFPQGPKGRIGVDEKPLLVFR